MERYLLGHLLNYKDEKGQMLSDDQIADNVIGVLFAAQDTTASVLTWILKYLHDDQKLLEAIKVRLVFCLPKRFCKSMQLTSVEKFMLINESTKLFCRQRKWEYMKLMKEGACH